MKQKLFGLLRTNRKGIALISVLGVVTLATILILALFSVSDAEFKAAKVYAEGNQARQFSDMAVNIVTSQIQAAATGQGTPAAGGTIWASQPGAVRIYNTAGSFVAGRKLYSSNEMVFRGAGTGGEAAFTQDFPSNTWDQQPIEWVDLNKPVTRVLSTGGAVETFFPIMDPNAAAGAGIEGFTYRANGAQGGRLPGVVLPSAGAGSARLPMPVQWLYILKDGRVGSVSQAPGSDVGTWVSSSSGVIPTAENPIVGRVAFWTDDETCKININTAGEPSYYALPTIFHSRDSNWANNPPAVHEYQRYPGHPATVALSSVLRPNPTDDPSAYNADSFLHNFPPGFIELKNAIYTLTPRLSPGGSLDGTLAFDVDDFSSQVTASYAQLWANYLNSAKEHLYTSVDEWIFDKSNLSGGQRTQVAIAAGGGPLITPNVIKNARSFLTAHSRGSELNMFGLPRIAVWPVADETLSTNFRTGYDSSILSAASLGRPLGSTPGAYHSNTYIFRRRDSQSNIVDMGEGGLASPGLQRNAQLMSYLDKLTNRVMPGGASFKSKYGEDDQRQILVQIFDYVRCTNLYDSFLDELYTQERGGKEYVDDLNPPAPGARRIANQTQLFDEVPEQFTYYTYTAPRFDVARRVGDLENEPPDQFRSQFNKGEPVERVSAGAYPGHGQVRPIRWAVGSRTYKGFGRFPTISEIALHFICTGDGRNDDGSFQFKRNGEPFGPKSGGKTAQKHNSGQPYDNGGVRKPLIDIIDGQEVKRYWYSNFPPFPSAATFRSWGCEMEDPNADNYAGKHPAWDPRNWNCTLETAGQFGVPLREDEKRIQAAVQFEMFVPSVGYTKYVPEFTIVVDGQALTGLEVEDSSAGWTPLFSSSQPLVVQSTSAYWGSLLGEAKNANNVSPMGGAYGTTPLMASRAAAAFGRMPADPEYNDSATSSVHSAMLNFPLVSNPFTVKRTKQGDEPARIKFRVPRNPVRIDIYASHDWRGPGNANQPVQSIWMKIPGAEGLTNAAAGDSGNTHSTPVPSLVVYTADARREIRNGNLYERDMVHPVRWWAFNSGGAVNRYIGTPQYVDGEMYYKNNIQIQTNFADQSGKGGTWGRFRSLSNTTSDNVIDNVNRGVPMNTRIYGYAPVGSFSFVRSNPSTSEEDNIRGIDNVGAIDYGWWGSDSVRSILPRHGDYRILAARPVVDAEIWDLHPVWKTNPNALFAHSLTGFSSDGEVGFDAGYKPGTTQQDYTLRLAKGPNNPPGPRYPTRQIPDTPMTTQAAAASQKRGDFDNGPGNFRDGAYINKPDDGNLSVGQYWYGNQQTFYQTRNAYFLASYLQMPAKNAFFTPNRMMVGPGMFGSLPTGVYGSVPQGDSNAVTDGVPWRTLLFRPNTLTPAHPGALAPADHNILDLFWMPVIEPYAISDCFSTAGKINLNFQMMPFTNVERSTAMHAALKGELITAISPTQLNPVTTGANANTVAYKTFKDPNAAPQTLWSDTDNMLWHRQVHRGETVKHMKSRLDFTGPLPAANGLFRTASQICEVHLIPARPAPGKGVPPASEPNPIGVSAALLQGTMNSFWNTNSLTGDNLRERPYANLLQKVTTKSNTFRVHFIAQSIKKARSVRPDQMDLTRDSVTAEYQGSSLIERFLDFTNMSEQDYPNFADMQNLSDTATLETYFRYRVIETKQFLP